MIIEITLWTALVVTWGCIAWVWIDTVHNCDEIADLRHRILVLEKSESENPFELTGKRKIK